MKHCHVLRWSSFNSLSSHFLFIFFKWILFPEPKSVKSSDKPKIQGNIYHLYIVHCHKKKKPAAFINIHLHGVQLFQGSQDWRRRWGGSGSFLFSKVRCKISITGGRNSRTCHLHFYPDFNGFNSQKPRKRRRLRPQKQVRVCYTSYKVLAININDHWSLMLTLLTEPEIKQTEQVTESAQDGNNQHIFIATIWNLWTPYY